MAFVKNTFQQLSLYDSLYQLSERQKKLLDKSWAKAFGDDIFPLIDEERFAPFYSDRVSRPNTPVNIVIGGLLLMRLLDWSDEEMIEALPFDVRLQYALHTNTYEIQPFSTNTFRRFRNRNEEYLARTGENLLEAYLEELTAKVLEHPKLRPLTRRLRAAQAAEKRRTKS